MRMLGVVLLAAPLAIGIAFSLSGNSMPTRWAWSFAAAFMLLATPVVSNYFTGSLTIQRDRIHWRSATADKRIALTDIVDVRMARSNGCLESLHVEGAGGTRISFESGLDHFDEIREFLLRFIELNNRERDSRIALGTHAYRKSFRIVTVVLGVVIAAAFVAFVPRLLSTGTLTTANLYRVAVAVFFGIVSLTLLAALFHDVSFELNVGSDGIRAVSWRGERRMLFHEIAEIANSPSSPIEELVIKDASGHTIKFHRFLENYGAVKRHVIREQRATRVFTFERDR